MVTPSAAVTETTRSLSPNRRSASPTTSYVASGSVVSIERSIAVVPATSSTLEPSSTSSPFTWKVTREVSELRATTKVIVYS